MFCGGSYYDLEAVCREYWTCGDGGWHCTVLSFICLPDQSSLSHVMSSLEGSVHSNDSLSDSSPPVPGVPTQVVQPVQTTPQVRCRHIYSFHEFVVWPRRSRLRTEGWLLINFYLTLFYLTLPTSRGQCCKQCHRQPRGFRQATSTTYSLCTLTRRYINKTFHF